MAKLPDGTTSYKPVSLRGMLDWAAKGYLENPPPGDSPRYVEGLEPGGKFDVRDFETPTGKVEQWLFYKPPSGKRYVALGKIPQGQRGRARGD